MQDIIRILTYLMVLILVAAPAHAAGKKNYSKSYDFTTSDRYAGLVVNADTGDIIYHRNATRLLYPASLTKMMTIYMTFKALDEGKLSMAQKLPISIKAASQPKTNLRLRPGQAMTVREALLGLIVHSANDSAVVLSEAMAGSEDAFADRMTEVAHALGMTNTEFRNASGLPNSEQVTTALDLARLAIALRRDYPQYYPLFSSKSFKFRGNIINTHNRVMHRYPWADGLKTGFISASGFNLVTSANRQDNKLVGVVMGGHTASARDNHMIQLLEYGYENLQTSRRAKSNKNQMFTTNEQPHNFINIPYKEGVFEVAYSNNGEEEGSLENSQSTTENEEVLGDLVDKGLHASFHSKPKKLIVKNVKPAKTSPSAKSKVNISNSNKLKTKTLAKNSKRKVIVIKSSKNPSAKNKQLSSKAKNKQSKLQVG